ncbi:MAG: hypothetical protein PQJ58_06170 [Spirochaetales bacterium]|nr:hypothetical protein [Spirochaetales bacterium]
MLTQTEQIDSAEIWADLQYHRVLNYLTGNRVFTHGSLRLVWLGAPWLALYSALEYEKDGGPLWVLHTEGLTGHLYDSPKMSPRMIFNKFAGQWHSFSEAGSLENLPVSAGGKEGREELKRWSAILKSMASDSQLW